MSDAANLRHYGGKLHTGHLISTERITVHGCVHTKRSCFSKFKDMAAGCVVC
jgi:hypothetical protein